MSGLGHYRWQPGGDCGRRTGRVACGLLLRAGPEAARRLDITIVEGKQPRAHHHNLCAGPLAARLICLARGCVLPGLPAPP